MRTVFVSLEVCERVLWHQLKLSLVSLVSKKKKNSQVFKFIVEFIVQVMCALMQGWLKQWHRIKIIVDVFAFCNQEIFAQFVQVLYKIVAIALGKVWSWKLFLKDWGTDKENDISFNQ